MYPNRAHIASLLCFSFFSTGFGVIAHADSLPDPAFAFIEDHCLDRHDSFEKKGDFDLESLSFDLRDRETFEQWVHVYDRFKHGQHIAFDRGHNYPLPNLFVSILQQMGIETDHFATSTGTMKGLELIQ